MGRRRTTGFASVIAALAGMLAVSPLSAQGTGTVQGTVTRSDNGSKVLGANVRVEGLGLEAVTGADGQYVIQRIPAGEHTLMVRWVGYRPQEVKVTVTAGATATADVTLDVQPIMLGEIIVSTASRTPERVVEAPAAVTMVDTRAIQGLSLTGQAPLTLASVPGVDVVQSGVNDINVNTRGFNSSLNRRILVLQDGRDLAVAFLGSQEWNALPTSLEDLGRVEMVRGPGSALYGANAFAGVLNITTPSAREAVGTRVSMGAGELSSFRADFRHAGVLSRGQVGYKLTGGYTQSDTWSRSRTATDSLDMRREYADADPPSPAPKVIELAALNGQVPSGGPTPATGDRKPLVNAYGTARLDYYALNGAVGTVEGGGSQVQNEIFVTGIGRVQIVKAFRPWVRANWSAEHYNLMAWYSGRSSPGGTQPTQVILASNRPLVDRSQLIHLEGQYNRAVLQEKLRFVLGGSFRTAHENTDSTLMPAADDNRSDQYYSAFGQVEYRPNAHVRLVAASRWDDGSLFKPQFSPKGALVISPNQHHSFRFTVNRAFQTPNYSEFFVRAPAAAPTASPAALEAALEGYLQAVKANVGAAPPVAALNLPSTLPWNFGAQTQILALGNRALDVEHVTGLEVGYKGDLSQRAFVSVDAYYNHLTNFVTDLLPGVNPAYPSYALTNPVNVPQLLSQLDAALILIGLPAAHPLRAPIPALQANYAALSAQLQPLLATLPDGSRAGVVSYTNAGEVNETGVELGLGVLLTNELRLDGTVTYFDFDVKSQQLNDQLLPNTPKWKGTLGLSYRGRQGLDLGASIRLVDKYDWAAGSCTAGLCGPIPGSQTVNANIGYRVNNNFRLSAVATNLLDQQRYQLYGGSVIGRRVMAGITAEF